MPPDFDKLPKPGEASVKSTRDIESDQSNIKNLLKKTDIEEDASSSSRTSEIIIPIGIIINTVQIGFIARSVKPTEVKAIVNRTIGPIKLILPIGPHE